MEKIGERFPMRDPSPEENPLQQGLFQGRPGGEKPPASASGKAQQPGGEKPSSGASGKVQRSGESAEKPPADASAIWRDPFAGVLGQSRPKSILQGALERDTLACSYLFFGPPGCGKLAVALSLARAVNCTSEKIRPCGHCSQCQKISQLRHPDVTVFFPRPKEIKDEVLRRALDKLAGNPYADISFPGNLRIRIDSVREIRSQAVMRPYEGRKKVFILAEADRMTDEAANALLKTLEEPPGHVLLVLTSARFGKLPSTVMSRCQQVRFTPLSQEEVAEGLKRLDMGDPESRRLASRLAQGDLRLAMDLVREDIGADRQETLRVLSAALDQDLPAILRRGRELGQPKDRASSRRRLEALQVWYRDLMLLAEGDDGNLVNADLIPQLSDMGKRYDWNGIQLCLEDIRESFRALDAHVNLELLWITLLSRLKRRRKNPV